MATCRSCGAWIVWAVTAKGKMMPIEKQRGGNVMLSEDLLGDPTVRLVRPGTGTHVSHFATCPQAPTWRKGDS